MEKKIKSIYQKSKWQKSKWQKSNRRKSSGQSIAELMIAVGIGGIIALATGSLFVFGVQQFSLLVDENQAQESLLESAFYVKSWLEQSAKISCVNGSGGAGLAPLLTTTALANDNSPPMNVARGKLDCRDPNAGGGAFKRMLPAVGTGLPGVDAGQHVWTQNVKNPFALFVRETGGSFNDVLGTGAAINGGASIYLPTGIYFTPPSNGTIGGQTIGMSGVIWFAQQVTGANLATGANFYFDHIVDIGVIGDTAADNTVTSALLPGYGGAPVGDDYAAGTFWNLQSLQIRIVARYITLPMMTPAISYMPEIDAPGGVNNGWVNLDMSIPINFKNNFLGVNGTGLFAAERGYGGIYFFRMSAPPMQAFEF